MMTVTAAEYALICNLRALCMNPDGTFNEKKWSAQMRKKFGCVPDRLLIKEQ